MPTPRAWLRTSQAAARLQVSAKTVTRWASEGRLTHRRTLGGHHHAGRPSPARCAPAP